MATQQELIAKQFTDYYYNIFDTNRSQLVPLYRDFSMMSYEDKQIRGAAAIVQHLTELPFQQIKHVVTKCDAQPSHPDNGSIIIMVMGQLAVNILTKFILVLESRALFHCKG
ncbi:Nuclear transport factor 2 [Blyttiomyces sp. JEL0837]|nr:Nuclear transport factor 2 [Blyttiomyces sp. JEL0837]